MENELAVIAIKGGRYDEAEQMFNADLKSNPSTSSYFGLGVCKLNMLLDVNRNVDEVIYCFEKAISVAGEEHKNDIVQSAQGYLLGVLSQYTEIYKKLETQKKEQATQAALGAALTIGAMAIGSSSNSNAFTQIASLAAAGAGVGVAVDGLNKLGAIPEMQQFIISTGEKLIREFVRIGVISENVALERFDSADLLEHTEAVKNQGKKQFEEGTLPIILAIFGVYRLYLGKWGSGLLFFFTAGGYGIWWAVDLYKIAVKKEFNPTW